MAATVVICTEFDDVFVRRDLHRRRKRSAWSFSRLSFRSSRVVSGRGEQTHSTRLCSLPARLLSNFNFGRRKNCAGARGTHDLVSAAKKTKQNGFSYSRICLPSTALLTCRKTSKWKHEWWTVARNENESKKKSWCCENVNKRLRPSRKRWCN